MEMVPSQVPGVLLAGGGEVTWPQVTLLLFLGARKVNRVLQANEEFDLRKESEVYKPPGWSSP